MQAQSKRFWSDAYQRFLEFPMTTAVIKQIKQLQGGIDEYLLNTPNSELLYQKAIKIKRNLRQHARKEERAKAIAAMEATGKAI